MKRAGSLLVPAACVLALAAEAAAPDAPAPSTSEERAEAVRLAGLLEQNPFGDRSAEQRALLLAWWKAVPDVNLHWCEPLMLDIAIEDEELAGIVLVQAVLSGGAFLLEHPDRATDRRAILLAGVEGALRTYRRSVDLDPRRKNTDLDELLELERAGRLAEYVDGHLRECE